MTDDPFAGVPAPLRAAMVRRGFTELTPVQRAVVDARSAGRNLRISSQTGSGKTAAIGLVLAEDLLAPRVADEAGANAPGAERGSSREARQGGPAALIIAPTRELAVQLGKELVRLFSERPGLRICVVTGGSDLRRERTALAAHPTIVVGTPGRMLDHLRTGSLVAEAVGHVVLDEADRMLDMGFREELEAILEALPADRRSHLVSATFPHAVRKLADRFQGEAVALEGTRLGEANQDIEHVAHLVHTGDRYAALVNTLLEQQGARCLVFVERRHEAADLAERLAGDGFAALPFSGELAQAQRTRTLAAFRNGSISILISTDVAARGIDVPDIGVVVQSVPLDAETYTHRAGRTGRAGRKGRSVLLVPGSAERRVRRLLEQAGITASWTQAPGPESIHKSVRKGLRRKLHGLLDADAGPAEKNLAYAANLLAERDPVQVIAALLDLAEPELPREPMTVRAPGKGGDRGRDSKTAGDARYEAFSMSWGAQAGATKPRVLSHICRRGQLRSAQVGAIQIGPHSTRFEIAAEVASAFAKRVASPDSRDPGVRIRRGSGAPPLDRGRGAGARRRPAGSGKAKHDGHRDERRAPRDGAQRGKGGFEGRARPRVPGKLGR